MFRELDKGVEERKEAREKKRMQMKDKESKKRGENAAMSWR